MEDSRRGNLWVWVGIAVVVIGVVLYFVWKPQPVPAPGTGTTPVGQSGSSQTFAPQGQVVAGFPQSLLLDSGAQVTQSYSIPVDSNTAQYTAEWNSSNSMASLFAQYENYLKANGWTVSNADQSAVADTLYATKGSTVVNASFIAQGQGSQAIVSYLGGGQ